MSRGPFNRTLSANPIIALVEAQEKSFSIAKIHQSKRKDVGTIHSPHVNKINYLQEQNATTRDQTKTIYDSRKEQVKPHGLDHWKILTLKQIKKSKLTVLRQQKQSNRCTSQQKLYVSISRSNRSTSKQQRRSTHSSPYASNNIFKHLSGLQNKRHIVQQVQNHLEEESKSFNFFCQ